MTQVIEAGGGKAIGPVSHLFSGTTNFSGFPPRAKASGAKVICLANSGGDAVNRVRQAAEFGMVGKGDTGQTLTLTLFDVPLVYAIWLEIRQGLTFSAPAFWDRNDASRLLAKRLAPSLNNSPTAGNHAGDYTGTYCYLKAAAEVGVAKAKADGRAVIAHMKTMRIEDPIPGHCVVRPDGRNVHEMLLMKIKMPGKSKGPFDLASVGSVVPGDRAFRPLKGAGRTMVEG